MLIVNLLLLSGNSKVNERDLQDHMLAQLGLKNDVNS